MEKRRILAHAFFYTNGVCQSCSSCWCSSSLCEVAEASLNWLICPCGWQLYISRHVADILFMCLMINFSHTFTAITALGFLAFFLCILLNAQNNPAGELQIVLLTLLSNEAAAARLTKSFSSVEIKPQTKMCLFGIIFLGFLSLCVDFKNVLEV